MLVTLVFLFIFENIYLLKLAPNFSYLPQVSTYINFNETLGFFSLGTPVIDTLDPSTTVSPGSSGLISGSRLYSGTTVELWTGGPSMGSYEYSQNLDTSGYNSTTHDTVEFTYPNSFFTGVPNYKIRTRNRRSVEQ